MTPAQVAQAVVSAIGTSGTYRAYIGGSNITPVCDSQPNTVVCIVDTGSWTNGKTVQIGSIDRRGTLNNPTTTATSGGVTPVAEVPAQPEIPAQDPVYPGAFVRTDIVASVNSYPKAATRVDCAGATCTYAEEMTNFANWWTYYRTRMQGMKTA
ncbi:MAG TPA: hypothetical protein VFF75_01940, partial [Methylophilaceae bacterium]|nr:hypothetical protein [Methylophilaceae bacterium]